MSNYRAAVSRRHWWNRADRPEVGLVLRGLQCEARRCSCVQRRTGGRWGKSRRSDDIHACPGGHMVIVRHRYFAIGQWLGEDAELEVVESTKVKLPRFLGLVGYFC